MDTTEGSDSLTIEEIANRMLGMANNEALEGNEEESEPQVGHPAWQQILNSVPKEFHSQIIPTLQDWDAGVNRRFQKIHDEYEPYKQFEDYDPDALDEAVKVYEALNNNPAATWEAIGRAYGLSPQQVSQAASSMEEDDFDMSDLPAPLRDRLLKLDDHERALEAISQELLSRQASEEEAAEDEVLDEILEELQEQYGDFDEDYVVGLIAAGVDPEDAVGRFQQITSQYSAPARRQQQEYPRVMSSGGGVPSTGSVDVTKLSNQNTQDLVSELLRLSQES